MSDAVNRFREFYEQQLGAGDLTQLSSVYSPAVIFQDPVERLDGIDQLHRYFDRMMTNVSRCRFEISELQQHSDQAFVIWQMYFAHPRLRRGKEICVDGSTHLRFGDQIDYHRDYYDLGAMLYEQIPLLGSAVHAIKNRLQR